MFNAGDKVMMMDEKAHASCPDNYPPKGTIGVVVNYSLRDETALVNWGKGSGVEPNGEDEYAWWCGEKRLEKVSANTQEKQKEDVNMSKFNVGDKVVFINAQKHKSHSEYYPAVDTVGTVVKIDEHPMIEDFGLLVNWGNAKGVDVWQADGTKSWWCNEADVKPYICGENDYTNDEVWKMLKPKMQQFALPRQNIDYFSQTIKNMIVAAYRSGYGRATKGRSFMIKPKAKKAVEKANIENSIDTVLGGKMIVTFYKDDNSYMVSEFDHALNSEQGMEIYNDTIYDSDDEMWTNGYDSNGGAWTNSFDVISDPDCEMYVAVPFSEAMGRFDSDSIKAMYCGDKVKALRYNIKPWAIGKFNGFMRVSNETRAFMKFNENDNSQLYPEIHRPEFKALVPLCDYLRVNGVNV